MCRDPEVAPLELRERTPHDLHILLRHRLKYHDSLTCAARGRATLVCSPAPSRAKEQRLVWPPVPQSAAPVSSPSSTTRSPSSSTVGRRMTPSMCTPAVLTPPKPALAPKARCIVPTT